MRIKIHHIKGEFLTGIMITHSLSFWIEIGLIFWTIQIEIPKRVYKYKGRSK
jgi:hypothetical protein